MKDSKQNAVKKKAETRSEWVLKIIITLELRWNLDILLLLKYWNQTQVPQISILVDVVHL
jgi:hypothetical protein